MERFIFLIIISTVGFEFPSLGQGNLLITPMRVVFEGNNQKSELNLINTGVDTATYSISFRQYYMNELGKLELIEKLDSNQMLAEPYLRLFPRQVTLAPGEPQVIMLQYRPKTNMKSGEYRSHLYFRPEKDYKALGKDKPTLESNQLSVTAIPIFGITIPVIIRSGSVKVNTSINNLKLIVQQDTIPILQFLINRIGNSSTYGDLIVEYAPTLGKPIQVGRLNRVAVYTNIDQRKVSITLNRIPGILFKSGNLKVRYTSPDDTKYMVYAEAELPITEQTGLEQQGATKDNGQ